jgi:hypothetical protein
VSVVEAVRGVQTPRIFHAPTGGDYGFADDALRWLAEVVGFVLDPWQAMILREALAESGDKWAATQVGLVVPRQNGKGAVLEARELVGLFLLREQLLIHSAHQFKTAQEHFFRLRDRIREVPELQRRVERIRTGAGEQGIELKTGERLRILARKGGSGRGFTAPFVALDEAMDLPESAVIDMVPTQSAMPRAQTWYTGSAVDQLRDDNGIVFARVRARGIAGESSRLLFAEWSLDYDNPDDVPDEVLLDDDALAAANPGYGIRIFRRAVEDEREAIGPRGSAVERGGVGDWPETAGAQDVAWWDRLAQPDFRSDGLTPCLAYDVDPSLSWSSIVAAFESPDGLPLLEVVERRRGVKGLVERIAELSERHAPVGVMCGASSAAEAFVHELAEAGVDVTVVSTGDHANACNLFVSRAENESLRHRGEDAFRSALLGSARRPYGDSWLWSRKNSSADISPLVAGTLALWGWSTLYDGGEFRLEVF